MVSATDPIERLVTVYCIGDANYECHALLRYITDYPWVVTVVFNYGTPLAKAWQISRALLRDGQDVQVGSGDVQVWSHNDTLYFIRISRDGDTRLYQLPYQPVAELLQCSYEEVPEAAEKERVETDLEATLSKLLGKN